MLYSLEFFENPDLLVVNVDELVVDEPLSFRFQTDRLEKQFRLVQDLFKIKGIASVYLYQYHLEIYKGNVFEWRFLISAILFTISQFDEDGEMVEARRPVKIKYDKEGNQSRRKLKFNKPESAKEPKTKDL